MLITVLPNISTERGCGPCLWMYVSCDGLSNSIYIDNEQSVRNLIRDLTIAADKTWPPPASQTPAAKMTTAQTILDAHEDVDDQIAEAKELGNCIADWDANVMNCLFPDGSKLTFPLMFGHGKLPGYFPLTSAHDKLPG